MMEVPLSRVNERDCIEQIQAKIAKFCEERQLSDDITARCLDLQSELGELSKEYLRQTDYGRKPFAPSSAWQNEIGDVLFSLVCLANQSQTSLSAGLSEAMEKYEIRWHQRGSISSPQD